VTQLQVVVTGQIVGNGKFVVVVKVVPHHGLVAAATTAAVAKLASGADTGVLAVVFAALPTKAFALAVGHDAPLALAVAFALVAFALLALAVAVALECIALVTVHQLFHADKTTVRAVELTKGIQVHVIRHDVKAYRVGSKLKIRKPHIITYFIIISKSIFFTYSI
jgi:hypothetical protein